MLAFFAVSVPARVTALTRCGRRDREDSLIRALRAGVVALAASPARTMGASSSDEEGPGLLSTSPHFKREGAGTHLMAAILVAAVRNNRDAALGFGTDGCAT